MLGPLCLETSTDAAVYETIYGTTFDLEGSSLEGWGSNH